jgi:hypothetical protein
VGNRRLRVGEMVKQDICCAAVGTESPVNRQIKVRNGAKLPKDFVEMLLRHILGQALHHNLPVLGLASGRHARRGLPCQSMRQRGKSTLVLLIAGLALLSLLSLPRLRLQLRLSRPLRRGGGVGDRVGERES